MFSCTGINFMQSFRWHFKLRKVCQVIRYLLTFPIVHFLRASSERKKFLIFAASSLLSKGSGFPLICEGCLLHVFSRSPALCFLVTVQMFWFSTNIPTRLYKALYAQTFNNSTWLNSWYIFELQDFKALDCGRNPKFTPFGSGSSHIIIFFRMRRKYGIHFICKYRTSIFSSSDTPAIVIRVKYDIFSTLEAGFSSLHFLHSAVSGMACQEGISHTSLVEVIQTSGHLITFYRPSYWTIIGQLECSIFQDTHTLLFYCAFGFVRIGIHQELVLLPGEIIFHPPRIHKYFGESILQACQIEILGTVHSRHIGKLRTGFQI